MSNVVIDIAAEFTGKKAFKQADTAANKLNKTVKSLGQSFGFAFGGAALGYAIKSTIRDFADAQRETQQLNNTVKNLGLAFAAPEVDAYVQKIGKLYGVTGDQAVPAMQALLTATGSVSRSTKIMNVALDLAASRNADVTAVAKDLASAYVGNTKGLNQYRLGLTKAELAAMGFDEILDKIGSQTLGAADEAAQTLSGQLAILAEVSNQAKERIGGGLFEALGGIAGQDGAGGAAKNIENLSIKLTNAITGFGYLTEKIKIAAPILAAAGVTIALAWAPWFTGIAAAALAIGALGNAMKKSVPQTPMNTGKLFFPSGGDGGYKKRLAAEAKAEREAAARAKELLAFTRKAAIAEKNKLSLTKASAIFDLNKIQIAAALKNTYDIQERTRLEALMAIENEDGALALKKIEEIAALQKNSDIQKLAGIKTIKDETLAALNEQLLTELRNINASKLAEAEKDDMRNIAFGKYNAALSQAGDVMEKSYYSERVQIQLTEIAKIAAASNSVNAMITLEKLRMTVSIDVIDAIREKQSAADKERYAALLEYIRLLETLGGKGVGLAGASDDSIKTLIDASKAEADALLIESNAIDAMNRASKLVDDLYNIAGGVPSSAKLGANVNATDFFNSLSNMNQTSFGGYSPSMNSGAAGSVPSQVNYVTVNTAAVGSEDFLARTIQQVIQDINRNGSSTSWAGAISS